MGLMPLPRSGINIPPHVHRPTLAVPLKNCGPQLPSLCVGCLPSAVVSPPIAIGYLPTAVNGQLMYGPQLVGNQPQRMCEQH